MSLFQENYPWIYESGMKVINILNSRTPKQEKYSEVQELKEIIEFTFEHPIMQAIYGTNEEDIMYYRKLGHYLIHGIEGII